MVSLTMSEDKIIDELCIQSTFADAVGMWCNTCANQLVISQKIKEVKSQIGFTD